MALQRILSAALLWHGVIAGPSDSTTGGRAALDPAPRLLHGRFLHISDIHPDEFYRVHSSTDETEACHRGDGPAGTYGAETSDCDTPFALVNATFDWIAANLKDKIDFVIWTGDSARHDSDEEIPRNQGQVLGTNTWIADKFAELFAHPEGRGLEIPVVPTFGNNDILPHNILLPGPNAWLQHYTHIWRHFIPEEQRHSFEFGGWFFVEAIPDRLAIFSLNTLYFFDRNAGVDGCANPYEPGYKQLEWLSIQLQFMRHRGMKAILMGHVPPARTDSKKLWDETCWQKYTLWLQQYRDVVVGGIYGHMNIDHFLIHDTHDIDLDLLENPDKATFSTRQAMQDELSVESATDYLQELRSVWSKLAPPPALAGKSDDLKGDKKKKKGRKGKKKKDLWGERYQLTLVSPSVVPNYFPTLRIVEYNISGLENAPVWADRPQPPPPADQDQKRLELRSIDGPDNMHTEAKKKKKPKKPKDGKPKNPHLIIPDPPSPTAPPGPGYSVQPLSLTGYTQYYANLTYINNLTLDADTAETDTFDDKIYKLRDLTVNSYVDLAYRMGQTAGKNEMEFEPDSDVDELDEDEVEEDEAEADAAGKKGKKPGKGKDKKKKHKRKKNKTWLAFLNRAFVSTVEKEELQKLGKLRRRARRSRITMLALLALLALLLLAPLYTIYYPPSALMRVLSQRWTDVLWRIWLPPTKKLVALTIDDAPSEHTRDILAALSAGGAKATFFVIGSQVAGREHLLREIVRAGHELGNHGMRDEPAREVEGEELGRQIRAVQGMISAAYAAEGKVYPGEDGSSQAGKRRYYRPGSGFFSDRVREVVRQAGHRLVLGSIYPHDAQVSWAWLNARHILGMLSPGGIIICHDRRSWTEPMLRRVLPEMKRRGYKAVTVTELLAEATG
ncbi:hydrolase-like protein [Echria macrotheca]|uniref:Hydrolase-like protein n=1 Tax=Echria macrotheca TaxID=438768 RepID=A0AAJ0BIC7_9PEZI|nr:hydrolase-like protein [Echria macrotheca]